jgi:hypothetical protein
MTDFLSKEPQTKIRKFSTEPANNVPSDIPASIESLDKTRQGPAKLIHRGLDAAMTVAEKSGVFKLTNGVSAEQKSLQLSLEIERAVFDTHSKESYITQAKTLGFNLKANQELCNRLLSGSLTPSKLATMTGDEMQTKEMQQEMAEMQARNEKQSIMVTDDQPRIRRTHKGDELIEDGFAEAGAETAASNSNRRRSMLDPNGLMASRSRENSVGDGNDPPVSIDAYRSNDDIRGQVAPKAPISIDTQTPPALRKSSSQTKDFDLNKVFSSVKSPTIVQPARRPSGPGPAPSRQGPGEDPEIDKLLADDNGPESPPYSPSQYDADPSIVWRGTLNMNSVASFSASAKHVAGADLSKKGTGVVSWSSLIPKDLNVAGRIDLDKANEYLCGLRYSNPTDIVVVNLTPSGEIAEQDFTKIYEYFHSKNRYGVIGNKGFANVRDTYLIPVPPGTGNIPEFMQAFEHNTFPENRTEASLLVVLVVRIEQLPRSDLPVQYDGTGTPAPYGHPQRQMSMSSQGPNMSPMAPQGGFNSPTTPVPQQHPQTGIATHYTPTEAYRAREDAQRRGEATALEILGPLFHAPTMSFLLPQAHLMHPQEWRVIREIFEADVRAQGDLQHLSTILEQRNRATTAPPPPR